MRLRLIVSALWLLLVPILACAQEGERFFSRYNFRYLTEGDGMPSGTVNDIIQDSDGFIWVATPAGIGRYDGYEVMTVAQAGGTLKLQGAYVNALCEDNFHRLWIGTENGLVVMDLGTYAGVDGLVETDGSLPAWAGEDIHALYKDKRGDIWVSYAEGLCCVELDERGEVSGCYRLEKPCSLPVVAVSDVGEVVCAGLDNQVYVLEKGEGQRLEVRSLSDGLTPFSDDWRINCMQEDGQWLWMGTNRGLFRYDTQTHELKRYRYSTHRPGMLSQAYITDIRLTDGGHLIVSTLNGLNVYRRETDSFEFIRRNSAPGLDGGSINCDAIRCVYTTGETIWLGTETGGVNLLPPGRLQASWWDAAKWVPAPGGNLPVNAIDEDRDGNLWMSLMERGLVCWNPATGDCRRYVFEPHDTTSLSNNTLNGLLIDRDGHLWAYTWGVGINELAPDSRAAGRFRRFTREAFPTLRGDFISSACEDTLNNVIWLGSTRGLLFYDKRTGCFERVRFNGLAEGLEFIPALCVDRRHRLWVGTTRGLLRVDLQSFACRRDSVAYVHYRYKLDNPASGRMEKISSILEDAQGTLWLGGNGTGLYRMKEDGQGQPTFVNYTVRDGLPDNTVTGMVEDGQGRLWITTPDGFCRLDARTMSFTNYTADDGLSVTQYYGNGIHYSERYNRIYLSTNVGMLIVRPDEMQPVTSDREVRLASLSVAGVPVRASSLTLHEGESRLSVRLTTCDYGGEGRIRYAYRMMGYEEEWNETQPGDGVARYTAVPPGDYTLQVRATDESGRWSDRVTGFPVRVVPYFYKTGWFYLSLLVLASFSVWVWYRWKIRHYREQRAELERKVETLTEERISFFTNITHEFRTPVTLIHGPIEHALREVTDERVKAELRIAERNSSYLLSLVNELMDFRKLDMDRVTLECRACDIVGFLSDLLLPFTVFAKERGVEIRLYSHLRHPQVCMDVAYMRKALVNLVANAVKFTPDGGRIDVFVASVPDGKRQERLLYINVRDTGCGIAEEDLDRIFDRFYQSKVNDRHPVFGQSGTGIGLFLCKKIVELHGGRIYARNNRGRGASFRILMPLVEGTEETSPSDTGRPATNVVSPAPSEPDGNTAHRKPLLLVVEDNRDMRAYICMLLAEDCRLLEAENGKVALDLIRQYPVDLIVSDLMMPVMDGLELSARVKADFATSHIPFLMLTALTSEAQRKKSFEIGVDEYLSKPFDEDEFRLRIRNMLRLRDCYKRKFSASGNVDDLNIKEDSHDHRFMNRAMELMEAHYADADYDLESFVRDMGYSKTLVNKKMQALAGLPIGKFMKNYRLNVARKMLEQGMEGTHVSEVAYAVGFNDPKYFTRCFKEFFGYLPSTGVKRV